MKEQNNTFNSKNKNIQNIDSQVDEFIYGITPDDKENVQPVERLEKNINQIVKKLSSTPGNQQDILALFNAVYSDLGKIKPEEKKKFIDKKVNQLQKSLSNQENLNLISQMMQLERNRILNYKNYEIIFQIVTQLAEACNTYVENIISPDDASKNSIAIELSSKYNSYTQSIFSENIKKLKQKYDIDSKITSYIRNSLYKGDEFILVDHVGEAFSSYSLSEENQNLGIEINSFHKNSIPLSECILLNENDISPIDKKLITLINEEVNKISRDENIQNILKKELVNYIDNNIQITENYHSYFFNDIITLNEEFNISDQVFMQLSEEKAIKNPQKESKYKSISTIDVNGEDISFKKIKKKIKNNYDFTQLNGSVIKILKPENTIKLWANGFTYGYYYIETVDGNNPLANNDYTKTDIFNTLFQTSQENNLAKSKNDFLYEFLLNGIIKKINKKVIVNNPELKYVILNLLQQKNLYDKKINIVFIPASKVIHFYPNDDIDIEYGISIFENVMFTAKLYISILLTNVMMTLVRGNDKRAWYVDINPEEKEIEAAIQRTMQDVKSREIKFNNFGDIQTILNLIGQFDDYYFPTIDGEKPLDLEIIEGQKVDLENNEFLDFLLKATISGTGVPSAHLNYTEDIELAKTLTMINGKFIRKIILLQKAYTYSATQFVRALYKNEFIKNNNYDEIDVNDISVTFPSPATLNLTNLTDLINNAQSVIEKIVSTFIPEGQIYSNYPHIPLEKLKFEFTKEVTKKIINIIDWKEYEELLTTVVNNIIKENPNIELRVKDEDENGNEQQEEGNEEEQIDNSDSSGMEGIDMNELNDTIQNNQNLENPPAEQAQTSGDTNAGEEKTDTLNNQNNPT